LRRELVPPTGGATTLNERVSMPTLPCVVRVDETFQTPVAGGAVTVNVLPTG